MISVGRLRTLCKTSTDRLPCRPMPTERSVLLIDDNPTFLRHVVRFIERRPELRVTATAQRVDAGIAAAEEMSPDVILIDLSMPERSGLNALPDLRTVATDARIIMLTLHEAETYRQRAFERGADGFVHKRALTDDLLDAIFPEGSSGSNPEPRSE